jgi:hypothetical protein
MTETTDRPPNVREFPPETAAPEMYRPLSLLALIGFGLAVVYALIVVVGAAIALYGRTPWLMKSWTFLLPLSALVVCWAARARIRAAENTLSGLAFSTWGFRLVVSIGLTYSAYYMATFFAVRGQAVECADRFFDYIKKGQEQKAFSLSVGIPTADLNETELRNTIESRFNNPSGPTAAGPYTQFRQSQYVRFIQIDGEKTSVIPLGVVDWDYAQGGYNVLLKYLIKSSLGEFEMLVKTFGRDPKPGEPKGLQWQILMSKGETGALKDTLSWTPEGKKVMAQSSQAQSIAKAWTEKVNRQQWGEAYLDTLEPAERARMRRAQTTLRLLAAAPLAGLGPLGLCDAICRNYLLVSQGLSSAQLIHIDKSFWAGASKRKEILERIQKTFESDAGGSHSFNLTLQESMPSIHESEGRTTQSFDVSLHYMTGDGGSPQYIAEGRLVLVEEHDANQPQSAWRIAGIYVDSGRTPPDKRPERSSPPNPMMGAGIR